MVTRQKGMRGRLDALEVAFDDERVVVDAGLILPATLCDRLGATGLLDGLVKRPADPPSGAGAGAKALSVVFAMLAGADSIDDIERLRAGAAGAVLGLRPRAGSTCGKWLRALGFGQVRQLDAAAGGLLARAWGQGARPERLVIDLDSSITEVHGHKKAGARYGHTRVLGYHPLFATSATSGDVIHARLRHGAANTQYGAVRFFEEAIARCRRAGHGGSFLVRADSGFVNYQLFRANPTPRRPLLGRRHDAGPRARGDRADRRVELDTDRLPGLGPGRDRRDHDRRRRQAPHRRSPHARAPSPGRAAGAQPRPQLDGRGEMAACPKHTFQVLTLQRGHGRMAVVRADRPVGHRIGEPASTGHGRMAVVRPGRAVATRAGRLAASTGPRPDGRGELGSRVGWYTFLIE